MTFTYLDIGILVVVGIFFIVGIKKGFIDSILSLIGGLVSLVIAVYFAGQIADLIYPVFGIGDSINGSVLAQLTKLLNPENLENDIFTSPIGNPENILLLVTDAIAKLGLPESFTASISSSIADSITAAIASSEAAIISEKSLVEILSPILTRSIMLVIATTVSFIVIRIVMAILESMARAVLMTSKSLRSLNNLLGGIFGAVKGGLVVVIVFTVAFFVLGGTEPNSGNTDIKSEIRTTIANSTIASEVYRINPVPQLIADNINIDEIINNLLGRTPTDNVDPDSTLPPEETPLPDPTVAP